MWCAAVPKCGGEVNRKMMDGVEAAGSRRVMHSMAVDITREVKWVVRWVEVCQWEGR